MSAGSPTRSLGGSIFGASALVFSSTLCLSLAGYIYNAIASRHLGIADYGALYALLALYNVAILPNALFGPVIAKFAAEFHALADVSHQRGLVRFTLTAFAAIALGYCVLGLVLAIPLAKFMRVAPVDIAVVGFLAAICAISAAIRAVSQGAHAFGGYSLSVLIEALGRVGGIFVLAFVGTTVIGGLAAFGFGLILGAVSIVASVIRRYRGVVAQRLTIDWKRVAQTSAAATSIAAAISVMGFADVVLVKHYFNSETSGLYAGASLCAKIIMYFVSFIPAVLVPQAASRHAKGESTRRALWFSFGFVAIASMVSYAAYALFGPLILRVVVGTGFADAVPMLLPYALAMIFLGMTNTLGSYALATHRLHFVAPLILFTIGTLASMVVFHPSVYVVIQELVVGNALMLLVTAIPLVAQSLRAVHR